MNEKKPKVLLVGGMAFNIPSELRSAVDIVKHVEQGTKKLASMPAVDYVLVISEFAGHNMVDSVKSQATVPVILLKRGWASMKEELVRRCILPLDPTTGGEAAVTPEKEPETQTISGLSEDALWKAYKTQFIDAVKGALKPRELVSEADLLEILVMVAGSEEDCRLMLPRLQTGGVIDCPKDGFWRSLIGGDGFGWADISEPIELLEPAKKRRPRSTVNQEKKNEADDRARRIKGLPFGPYASKRAIARKMLEYEEWNPGGTNPASVNTLDRLIERAISLKVIDDTQKNLLIDHDETVGLKAVVPDPKQEEEPVQLPVSPARAPAFDPIEEQAKRELEADKERLWQEKISFDAAKRKWPEVCATVKKQKRLIGTILESCRLQWIDEEKMVLCMIPAEFSMYRMQLDSTDNWGLITKVARELLGKDVVVRFLIENRITR